MIICWGKTVGGNSLIKMYLLSCGKIVIMKSAKITEHYGFELKKGSDDDGTTFL